jgi:hypothetical protein
VQFDHGLFYPSRGRTACTGVEMALALQLGATLDLREVHYFPFPRHEDARPILPFADYLALLTQLRAGYPRGSFQNLVLKEMANSIYGKLAQGLGGRPASRRQEQAKPHIRPSAISTPHYAAAYTGIIRAALMSVITGLAACPGFRVLSATTDGCMLIVPRRFEIEALPQRDGTVDPSAVALLDVYPELRALEQYPAN